MRCLLCLRLSISPICKKCNKRLLKPTLHQRELECKEIVYSLYPYNEVEELLLTKHSDVGYSIYKALSYHLAEVAHKIFDRNSTIVPIESNRVGIYSHTALLARGFKKMGFKVAFGALQDRSGYKYSGKSLEFRLKNRRDFEIKKELRDVILIDDIITTGLTFSSAITALRENGVRINGCIALSDARNITI